MAQLLDMATGNRVHAVSDRKDDLYETPAVAIQSLLKVEAIPSRIWEPCCGPGSIVRELRASGRSVVATDLVKYGCEDSAHGRDFLMELRAPENVDAIVTNPPFKLAEEFAHHAIQLVPHVAFLMRVAFLEGLRWQRDGLDQHLARVHVFAPRLPMMHRDGWEGPKNSNSGMAFAWFVFHRGYRQMTGIAPQIHWINWRKQCSNTSEPPCS